MTPVTVSKLPRFATTGSSVTTSQWTVSSTGTENVDRRRREGSRDPGGTRRRLRERRTTVKFEGGGICRSHPGPFRLPAIHQVLNWHFLREPNFERDITAPRDPRSWLHSKATARFAESVVGLVSGFYSRLTTLNA